MSEKRKIQRFNLDEGRIWEAIEGLSPFKTTYTLEEVCEKLNEQQATNSALRTENNHLIDVIKEYAKKYEEQQDIITELERKVKKYARIGEEQLEQIIDLQEELNECRARPTLATDERGVVKVEYKCR